MEQDRALQQRLRERISYLIDDNFFSWLENAFSPESYKESLRRLEKGQSPAHYDRRVGRIARLVGLSGLSRDTVKNFCTKGVLLPEKDRQALTRAVSVLEKEDWEIALLLAAPGTPLTRKEMKKGIDLRDLWGRPEHFPKLKSWEQMIREIEAVDRAGGPVPGEKPQKDPSSENS